MQSEHINLHITDETSELKAVVLGITTSYGERLATNAKVAEAIKNQTYPSEADVAVEIDAFEQILNKYEVTVFRPTNIDNLCQIFVRDIGFVIDDYFVVANMKEPSRRKEIEGFAAILSLIDTNKIIYPPESVYIEGGDIVQLENIIFVGTGRRTNKAAADFLREAFPNKQIISFQMKYDTDDPYKSILHLDCAFQPIGEKWALFYEDGFVSSPQPIIDIFGKDNLITISSEEMYQMFPNIFSLSTSKIITCSSFTRLNNLLIERGIHVVEIPYDKISLFGGLLRCSTLPLARKKNYYVEF